MFCDNYGNRIPLTGSLQVGAVAAPAGGAGSQTTTQRARHVSRRVYVHVCTCVCVCAICYMTQLVKGQYFLLSISATIYLLCCSPISVSKTVCPPFCPERCSELDGVPFCCNTRCAAGCIGGITESHCVVSVNGGRLKGGDGGGKWLGGMWEGEGWEWWWEGNQR